MEFVTYGQTQQAIISDGALAPKATSLSREIVAFNEDIEYEISLNDLLAYDTSFIRGGRVLIQFLKMI